jgi:hypothetical protein
MYQFTRRPRRVAAVGMIAVGVAVAISSVSIVRAERANPDKHKTYSCSSGTACLEGSCTGSSTWGVYGVIRLGLGVRASRVSSGALPSGSGDGVYSESADTTNLYEALEAKADSSNTSSKGSTPRPTACAPLTTTRLWHAQEGPLSKTCARGIRILTVNTFSLTRRSRRRQLSKTLEPRGWLAVSQTLRSIPPLPQ